MSFSAAVPPDMSVCRRISEWTHLTAVDSGGGGGGGSSNSDDGEESEPGLGVHGMPGLLSELSRTSGDGGNHGSDDDSAWASLEGATSAWEAKALRVAASWPKYRGGQPTQCAALRARLAASQAPAAKQRARLVPPAAASWCRPRAPCASRRGGTGSTNAGDSPSSKARLGSGSGVRNFAHIPRKAWAATSDGADSQRGSRQPAAMAPQQPEDHIVASRDRVGLRGRKLVSTPVWARTDEPAELCRLHEVSTARVVMKKPYKPRTAPQVTAQQPSEHRDRPVSGPSPPSRAPPVVEDGERLDGNDRTEWDRGRAADMSLNRVAKLAWAALHAARGLLTARVRHGHLKGMSLEQLSALHKMITQAQSQRLRSVRAELAGDVGGEAVSRRQTSKRAALHITMGRLQSELNILQGNNSGAPCRAGARFRARSPTKATAQLAAQLREYFEFVAPQDQLHECIVALNASLQQLESPSCIHKQWIARQECEQPVEIELSTDSVDFSSRYGNLCNSIVQDLRDICTMAKRHFDRLDTRAAGSITPDDVKSICTFISRKSPFACVHFKDAISKLMTPYPKFDCNAQKRANMSKVHTSQISFAMFMEWWDAHESSVVMDNKINKLVGMLHSDKIAAAQNGCVGTSFDDAALWRHGKQSDFHRKFNQFLQDSIQPGESTELKQQLLDKLHRKIAEATRRKKTWHSLSVEPYPKAPSSHTDTNDIVQPPVCLLLPSPAKMRVYISALQAQCAEFSSAAKGLACQDTTTLQNLYAKPLRSLKAAGDAAAARDEANRAAVSCQRRALIAAAALEEDLGDSDQYQEKVEKMSDTQKLAMNRTESAAAADAAAKRAAGGEILQLDASLCAGSIDVDTYMALMRQELRVAMMGLHVQSSGAQSCRRIVWDTEPPAGIAPLLLGRAQKRLAARESEWYRDPELTRTYGALVAPAARNMGEALRALPANSVLQAEFKEQVAAVKTFRHFHVVHSDQGYKPYPARQAVGAALDTTQAFTQAEVCLIRCQDILVDLSDHVATRKILLDNMPLLVSKWKHYVKLRRVGSAGRFAVVEPPTIPYHAYESFVANGAYAKLWGFTDESQAMDGLEIHDLFSRAGVRYPNEVLIFAQFWQLALDTQIICRECQLAAIGRMFLWSTRQEGTVSAKLSVQNRNSPHDIRNQCHFFEFIETLIRVANQKFERKAQSVSQRFQMCINNNLKPHTNGTYIIDSKLDKCRSSLDKQWDCFDKSVQDVLLKYHGGLEYVYRYYSLAEDLDENTTTITEQNAKKNLQQDDSEFAEFTTEGNVLQLDKSSWRSRTSECLGATMSYNEANYEN
jgi:hypothetical protein